MSKSIKELSQMDGRVYVYLRTAAIAKEFLKQAETEGFTFCDGIKPTERKGEGRIAYGSGVKYIGNRRLIRIDYEKLISKNK